MRFFIFILWLLHFLPFSVLSRIGKFFGFVAYHCMRRRRHIAITNLRVCFPNMPDAKRREIALAHFQDYGRSLFDRSILWWSSKERVSKLIHLETPFPIEEVNAGPVIFICPHFVCLEIPGVVLTLNATGCSIYSQQKDPLFDKMLREGRVRFRKESILISRKAGVKPIIRALRKNMPFFMLPDMDFGKKDSAFVPFFGVDAATLVAPSRLAAITHAKVIPVIGSYMPNYEGWKVTYYPPWENYPDKDEWTSAKRMNEFIEKIILEIPSQYLWTHRRFKTRPEGAPSIYAKEDQIIHTKRK